MHGLVRCKHERRRSRSRGSDVSFWYVTIKILESNGTRDVSDVTHRKRRLRFEKSQLVEIETWAWRDEFVRYGRRTWCGVDGKASIERLCLFRYVEKPFNSMVIKSFVPELRSRKCFCVSGFLCYTYMSYEHPIYISHPYICLCYRILLGVIAMKGYSAFPNLQHNWSFVIQLLNVIFRTLTGRGASNSSA